MKVAIATQNFTIVSGHAGQSRQWLVYDLGEHHSSRLLPAPQRIELAEDFPAWVSQSVQEGRLPVPAVSTETELRLAA